MKSFKKLLAGAGVAGALLMTATPASALLTFTIRDAANTVLFQATENLVYIGTPPNAVPLVNGFSFSNVTFDGWFINLESSATNNPNSIGLTLNGKIWHDTIVGIPSLCSVTNANWLAGSGCTAAGLAATNTSELRIRFRDDGFAPVGPAGTAVNVRDTFTVSNDTAGSYNVFTNVANAQPAGVTVNVNAGALNTSSIGTGSNSTSVTVPIDTLNPGNFSLNAGVDLRDDGTSTFGPGGVAAAAGRLANTANLGFNFTQDVIATPILVPEPATLALIGLGLFGLGVSRRKRTA